jgi:phospho-N-acetylmuramoyl-pentapeptide-transferase
MTTSLAQGLIAFASGAIVWTLLLAMLRSGVAWRIAVDVPNDRSLHDRTVPRIGGLAVVGTAVAVALLGAPGLRLIAAVAGGLMLISAVDDRLGLPVPIRLATHLAGALFTAMALAQHSPWWMIALLMLLFVWSINLYNFMDGADGLAGGMAVLGFGAYALVAGRAGSGELALVSACMAGASAGFLVLNFPPARVFLGDAGSVPLGFLAASLGFVGWSNGIWPAWFPVLVFAPFVVDATLTLLMRALRGERVWNPHREHLYQRMVVAGLGHRRTVLIWYGLMAASAVTGMVSISWSIGWQIGLLAAWVALYATLPVALRRLSDPVRE